MKPWNFIQSLLPNFSRMTALDDCRLTKLEITTVTQPAYENAMRLFGNRKFLYPELAQDFEVFKRTVRPQAAPNTVVAVERVFKPMLSTLDMIERLIEKNYTDDIAGMGLTYQKASTLQMLESIAFASKYARRYLNYIMVAETSYIEDEQGLSIANDIGAAMVPADVRWLKDNFINFCTVISTLSRPTQAIEADLQRVPDVTITEQNVKTLAATAGEARLDPFMHGIVPIAMNPIYHIRMAVAEWQVDRLNTAKEEKKLLELRKIRMERSMAGKKDASLEKQIEYLQGRIENLDDSIRRREKQYA